MGHAMMSGWLAKDTSLQVSVVEPFDQHRERARSQNVQVFASIDMIPEGYEFDLVVVAVKPNMVDDVLKTLSESQLTAHAVVSVAAGITLGQMVPLLPAGTPVIRCMPNTPASIGEGMLVFCTNNTLPAATRNLVNSLFSASGVVDWIDDEGLMDAVTAISGSGPAYVFHFTEALTSAGEALGLSIETAALLARMTVAGAGKMTLVADASPKTLREQVTSPGGTTAAALKVFMSDDRLTKLVQEAATAARDRGAELGNATAQRQKQQGD